MSMKNIGDVMDKLGELQGNLEDVIDYLYDANGIGYGLMRCAVTSNNPKLKNFIGRLNKLRGMEREIGAEFCEFQNLALLLRTEGTGEMTEDAKKTACELSERLSDLSCELDQLSSRASWLEDHIDQVRSDLMDLCNITDIDVVEEEDGNK